MESVSSFIEFFYNFIPGAVFLIILSLILTVPFPIDANLKIATIIVLGLFIGFVLQGFTRYTKYKLFDRNKVYKDIKQKHPKTYEKASKLLRDKGLIHSTPGEEDSKIIKEHFYKMDNYLRASKYSSIIDHFAAKAAFWTNTFWIAVLLIIVSTLKIVLDSFTNHSADLVTFLVFLCSFIGIYFSQKMAKEYWNSQYDVVLKTFLMVAVLDLKIVIE